MAEILGYHPDYLWRAVSKVWPESAVVPGLKMPDVNAKACFVLCPLYSPGSLEESHLIVPPATITDSRVSRKVEAYEAVVSALHSKLKSLGGGLDLTVVFANKGVLGDHDYTEEWKLGYHKELYQSRFEKLSSDIGLQVKFYDYNELGVEFPVFVGNKPLPEGMVVPDQEVERTMLGYFDQLLKLSFALNVNKDSRKVVKNIIGGENMGFEAAFWVIAGYLAFDWRIHELIGDAGIYIMAERFDPLFWIYKLTPGLKRVNKVLLKA